ncbi:hypothetical protein BDP55DRAFT_683717 [Colletotrichum godetiae]|uniref:Secreted protein n=1 Tax=Colletotrichum godetiae TaxID=1209918 RepID=A0AAJ0ABQ4_9PEZI|nr:uncharacterized protein BDP55DRAFT_683717 [Colletotrichum godetiae]KAK1658060.1 hypothetical protein BDP55DRAFT_683717 [Colletotrichum godetiae]
MKATLAAVGLAPMALTELLFSRCSPIIFGRCRSPTIGTARHLPVQASLRRARRIARHGYNVCAWVRSVVCRNRAGRGQQAAEERTGDAEKKTVNRRWHVGR